MRWGWIGGLLIIGGTVLVLPAAALSGPAVASDDASLRDVNLLMNASLALLGSGVGVLGVFGPRPFHGRGIRIGLGALCVGLLSFVVFLTIPIPSGFNDASYGPTAYSLVIGAVASVLGYVFTVGALVQMPGPSRVVGSLLLASLVLLLLAVPLADELREFALIPLVLGVIGIGALAIRGDRSAPAASS